MGDLCIHKMGRKSAGRGGLSPNMDKQIQHVLGDIMGQLRVIK